MMLTGPNLGKRQQELNNKVNEAATQKISFDTVRNEPEKSDIDKLFKIDLASKYKNIDYIIEILKSEDSLYISRALKCIWIYEDKHCMLINTDYLHNNVFPFMSMQMKKKLLTAVSTYVRNEKRAESFYLYCKGINLPGIASKFLVFTSEHFKLSLIQKEDGEEIFSVLKERKNMKSFIGNSFPLAEAYLEMENRKAVVKIWNSKTPLYYLSSMDRNQILNELSYLYFVSPEKYLDLFEKYCFSDLNYSESRAEVNRVARPKLGLRVTRDIIKRFKNRVLMNPKCYAKNLNMKTVAKHITSEDGKLFVVSLLPNTAAEFWSLHFCSCYKPYLDRIPADERFQFVRKVFNEKYPGEPFETCEDFYSIECYELMVADQKEAWALSILESNQEILGDNRDSYEWYKFLKFETAFPLVKKQVGVTPHAYRRRYLLESLVPTVKNHEDLFKLLTYYSDRHANEPKYVKESFLEDIIRTWNVFELNQECWDLLCKLLYSVENYSVDLIQHILLNKDITGKLQEVTGPNFDMSSFRRKFEKLPKEKQEIVLDYILKTYVDKVRDLDSEDGDDDDFNVKYKAERYIRIVLNILEERGKTEKDVPDVITKCITKIWNKTQHFRFCNYNIFKNYKLTEAELLRRLKKDANLVCDFDFIRKALEHYGDEFKLSKVIDKLKIYFAHDIALQYLQYFSGLVSDSSESSVPLADAVYVIVKLGDNNFKTKFVLEHAPENPKVDHSKIDKNVINIQKAICRLACYSRPPLPFEQVFKFIKGDYVQYCLDMFGSYLVTLPPSKCKEFVNRLVRSPVSVQKHGLRLAFDVFSTEEQQKLILEVWKKSKNISLRMVLYTKLYQKVLDMKNEKKQEELFEILKQITLDITFEDHQDVINLLLSGSKIPDKYRSDYFDAALKSVMKFPDKTKNLERKRKALENIEDNIIIIKKDVIEQILSDHVPVNSIENQIRAFNEFDITKWKLLVSYIVCYNTNTNNQTVVEIVKVVMDKCIKLWNEVHCDPKIPITFDSETYKTRQFLSEFVFKMVDRNLEMSRDYSRLNFLLEIILKVLTEALPWNEIYLLVWYLNLAMITNKVIDTYRIPSENEENVQQSQDAIEASCKLYAIEVTKLIQEFIRKGNYHGSLVYHIAKHVIKNIENISDTLTTSSKVDIGFYLNIADGLTEVAMPQTYILALHILPVSCDNDCHDEEFKRIFSKIKKFANDEVQCFLQEKFVNADFKRRKYV